MILHSDLKKIREEFSNKDKCEFAIGIGDYHQEIIDKLSSITDKMNEEKIKSLRTIEEKYKEEILQIQTEYALYLKLNS